MGLVPIRLGSHDSEEMWVGSIISEYVRWHYFL